MHDRTTDLITGERTYAIAATSGCVAAAARRSNKRLGASAARICMLAALQPVLIAGCGGGQGPPTPPPPEVSVVVAQPQSIEKIVEAPGRVQAVRRAEVRARVDGIVQRRVYREGSDVQADQKLFLIDPRQWRANVSAAEALLVRAQATAANAAQDVKRYEGLVEDQAISQQEYDAAVARLRTAEADVAQASAQLEAAQLNLSYTVVTAPIAGRAGRAQVTEGALVSATEATLLTTIEQLDPVYVNFSQSSGQFLNLRRDIDRGVLKAPALTSVPVKLLLEDGSPYLYGGVLDFQDLSIDEATGTAAARAEFPNPQRMLLPGQFVRARIEAGVRPNAFLIPQRAVQVTENAANVLIVDQNNVVASREVELGELHGDNWVVQKGLQPGERVIVEGLQKVHPGAQVRISQAPPAQEQAPQTRPSSQDSRQHSGQAARQSQ